MIKSSIKNKLKTNFWKVKDKIMAVVPIIKKKEQSIQKFIDWDKFENIFYNNFYLENYKIVIKMPLVPRKEYMLGVVS